jgi:type I restriction enzyme R subunit
LNNDEVAFYDALTTNKSIEKIMDDETLKKIAKELVREVRTFTTFDFTAKLSLFKQRCELL